MSAGLGERTCCKVLGTALSITSETYLCIAFTALSHSVPCRAECHYEQEQCGCERLHHVCGSVPLQRMRQAHHPGRWVITTHTVLPCSQM